MDRKISNRLEARSWITPKMDNQALSTDVLTVVFLVFLLFQGTEPPGQYSTMLMLLSWYFP